VDKTAIAKQRKGYSHAQSPEGQEEAAEERAAGGGQELTGDQSVDLEQGKRYQNPVWASWHGVMFALIGITTAQRHSLMQPRSSIPGYCPPPPHRPPSVRAGRFEATLHPQEVQRGLLVHLHGN
jgi:hypothetical protein